MIAAQWKQLPRTITHVGYVFQLEYRQFNHIWYIGYFLTRCESKKRDKRAAFNLGFWTDKNPKNHTSSVGTPILTAIPLFEDSDAELLISLRALERNLVKDFGYTPPISVEYSTFDTDFEEIQPLSIPYKIQI